MMKTLQIMQTSSENLPDARLNPEGPSLADVTTELQGALFELRTGVAAQSERSRALELTTQFGELLKTKMEARLEELKAAGTGEFGMLRGAMEETKQYLYGIYAEVDERVGDSSNIREAVEKARVTRCGRLLGKAAMLAVITSTSIATVKGFDLGMSQIDGYHTAGLGIGMTAAAGIAKKTLSEPLGKLVKAVGAKFGERFMEEDDAEYLRKIRDDEKELGFELTPEQRADSMYRSKAADDIESLHQEILLEVVERSNPGAPSPHEVAHIIGEVTKRHISDLFDLEGRKRPFVGAAKRVAGDAIKEYVGSQLGPVAEDATVPVVEGLERAA